MTTDLNELHRSLRILERNDAAAVRLRYQLAFAGDTTPRRHLWMEFPNACRSTLARWWEIVAGANDVFVMWDPPPPVVEKALGAIGLPRDAVVTCTPDDFERCVDWFPEDFYVFDRSLGWTAVFTHERDARGPVVLVGVPAASTVHR